MIAYKTQLLIVLHFFTGFFAENVKHHHRSWQIYEPLFFFIYSDFRQILIS